MKSLVITQRSDFRIHSLVSPLKAIMEVGFIPTHDHASVESFGADLIFTDEIGKYPDGFDLLQISKLDPFINLLSYSEPSLCSKYESDISYIGPVSDLESSMLDLFRMGYNVKNFYGAPSLLPCYSGSISMNDCWNVYKNAKVSPVPRSDMGYRELDIIASDGNPLKYTHRDEFIAEALKGVSGKKFKVNTTKKAIFGLNTNFDRLSAIVEKMGFSAIAKKIKQEKACLV